MHFDSVRFRIATGLLAVAFLGCTGDAPEPVATRATQLEIMYLANEGFLLTAGGDKVLIDGLFRESGGEYASLGPDLRELVETAEPPFDTVDVVLATHHHSDHFHAAAVCRYLENNRLAEFVSTEQALELMLGSCDESQLLAGRVKAGLRQDGSSITVALDALRIEPLFLHHGTVSAVENLGFLIEIGGLTVLHMGDTQASPDELRAAGLADREIDLAFIPFWYFIDPGRVPAITEVLQPDGMVVMHIPPRGAASLEPYQGWDALVTTIQNRFDNTVVFSEPFETRLY